MGRAVAIGDASMLFIAAPGVRVAPHTSWAGTAGSATNALLFEAAIREVGKPTILFADRARRATSVWIVHRTFGQTQVNMRATSPFGTIGIVFTTLDANATLGRTNSTIMAVSRGCTAVEEGATFATATDVAFWAVRVIFAIGRVLGRHQGWTRVGGGLLTCIGNRLRARTGVCCFSALIRIDTVIETRGIWINAASSEDQANQ